MKNFGINLVGIPRHLSGTVKGGLQPLNYSGSWGDRGQGNELLSILEKGLSWIGDKFVNSEDYLEDGFNYLLTAPLAVITGKTKEIPRVIDLMKELRHNMSQNYAMNPIFDLVSPIKGGWVLKGLMNGSPLEKLLSKTGTININGLLAYLNKASKLELDVIGRILNNQFAGLKNIDYNALKKAVSGELITYSRVPKTDYEDYGIKRLGFKQDPVKFNTFTFESPRIPRGNDNHYDITTLGHSRTFTIPEEPDILYVMESQSDWGLLTKDLTPRFVYKRDVNGNTNIIFDKSGRFHYTENGKGMPYSEFMDLSKPNDLFPYHIAKTLFLENYPMAQVNHLHTNYLQRQLQENMIFAAQQGLKRMRYPTPETAAKIEGFLKTEKTRDFLNTELELDRLITNRDRNLPDEITFDNEIFYTDEHRNTLIRALENKLAEMQLNSTDRIYPKNHLTIINKYADFPKMFGKLFKGLEVRTVTDPKGNTWYEVDIPENFLQSEWLFKKGGVLGLNKIIGL